ncbi:DUF1830 domain-containing protein [Leptodesmis sp.]|uniref:DUF1830 domain-containing protein n=1 Tax=Leptodesmis sp. TaxID=3100501 RepID=UPI004053491A
MDQLLSPLPASSDNQLLCCYTNQTGQIQVIRISNIQNWYFERVVFPAQRLMFEAPSEAHLEVHVGSMASAILADRISCKTLQVRGEA